MERLNLVIMGWLIFHLLNFLFVLKMESVYFSSVSFAKFKQAGHQTLLVECNFNPSLNQRFQGKCLAIYLFILLQIRCTQQYNHKAAVPQPFWHQGSVLWKTIFPQTEVVGDGFQMIQTQDSYYLFYFYYYISSSLVHQELDPRGWGLCHK